MQCFVILLEGHESPSPASYNVPGLSFAHSPAAVIPSAHRRSDQMFRSKDDPSPGLLGQVVSP